MEFHIPLSGTRPDLAALRALLTDADPGAMLDQDLLGQSLRVASDLSRRELQAVVRQAGLDLDESQIQAQPSVCCGGCGG